MREADDGAGCRRTSIAACCQSSGPSLCRGTDAGLRRLGQRTGERLSRCAFLLAWDGQTGWAADLHPTTEGHGGLLGAGGGYGGELEW